MGQTLDIMRLPYYAGTLSEDTKSNAATQPKVLLLLLYRRVVTQHSSSSTTESVLKIRIATMISEKS